MYQKTNIDFAKTHQFEEIFLDYVAQKEQLKEFYELFPTIENFKTQIDKYLQNAEKSGENLAFDRENLTKILHTQYATLAEDAKKQNISFELDKKVSQNIDLITNNHTFFITTGHQLNIFSGQMYFIFKIVTAIKTAEILKKSYPDYNFIPVYWLASEDHDFEEIASFSLFSKKYTWESEQKGAVGRMNTIGIEKILNELPKEILEKVPFFADAYKLPTLAQATTYFVNALFGAYGLVCLDADNQTLKKNFVKIAKDELKYQYSAPKISKTSTNLASKNYKAQITPRPINLFYLDNNVNSGKNLRERIVRDEKDTNKWQVLNTSITFDETQLEELVKQNPEKISPNVALRPIYQQILLPNLAYIGGPGELAYWLQLKEMFDFHQKNTDNRAIFPILMPRNFALVVTAANQKKMDKLGLLVADMFENEASLKKKYLEKNTDGIFSMTDEYNKILEIFKTLTSKIGKIDKTLESSVLAEEQKMLKSLENLEKRTQKAQERTQETQLLQVLALKEKFFPNGSLQERTENFLNFYLNNPTFIADLMELFEPFDNEFNVLTEKTAL